MNSHHPDHHSNRFGQWLTEKSRSVTTTRALLFTLIAGLITGPIAAIGFLIEARPTGTWVFFYLVVFGPAIEELLKQSGMIYLLVRKPWRIIGSWQFPVAAVLSAAAFATVENILYLNVYAIGKSPDDLADLASYRWTVCTMVHICCSIIASLGLQRVWRHQRKSGQPAKLTKALPLIAFATLVHGLYNLATNIG